MTLRKQKRSNQTIFFTLFQRTREFLKKRSSTKLSTQKLNNFMLLVISVWYLQKKAFFRNDSSFFIHQFQKIAHEENPKAPDPPYQFGSFLTVFFSHIFKISLSSSVRTKSFHDVSFWDQIPELGSWWIIDNQNKRMDNLFKIIERQSEMLNAVLSNATQVPNQHADSTVEPITVSVPENKDLQFYHQ